MEFSVILSAAHAQVSEQGLEEVGEPSPLCSLGARSELKGKGPAALAAWWDRAWKTGTLQTFQGSSELDLFIGKGDGIWLAVQRPVRNANGRRNAGTGASASDLAHGGQDYHRFGIHDE